MDMLVMDIPEHYIFRVHRTETIRYPCVYDRYIDEIRSCLEITWLARMILEDTLDHFTSATSRAPISFKTSSNQGDLLPTFYKKKSK
jgi:hypothetical protein